MCERYEVSSTKSGILLIILRPKRRVRVNNCRNGRSAIATEHPSLPDVINQKSDIDERGPYYARWFHAASTLLVEKGLLTRDELESGHAAGKAANVDLIAGDAIPGLLRERISGKQDDPVPASFHPGDAVRARNIHPQHHTRAPRYIRGNTGTVKRDYGFFTVPDSNAQNAAAPPQHVYSVRFTAREVWGPEAPARDALYIDMWDDYLEPVGASA